MIENGIKRRYTTESLDIWNYLFKDISDLQMFSTVEFEDRIEYDRLSRAARLLLDAEPITACHLQEGYFRLKWVRFDNLDSKISCRLIQSEDTTQEIKNFAEQKMDLSRDILVQMILIRNKNDTLCIKVHHAMMDGGGLVHCMSILFDIYNKLGDDDSYIPKVNGKARRGFKQLTSHLNFEYKIKCIKRVANDFIIRHEVKKTLSFPKLSNNPNKQAIISRHIESKTLLLMKDYCKKQNATINDLLLAGFSSAMYKLLDPARNLPLQIDFTADLRKRYMPLKKAETICNLTGLASINLFPKPRDTMDDFVKQVRDKTSALKKDGIGLMVFPVVDLLKLVPFSWQLHNCNKRMEHLKAIFVKTGYNPIPLSFSNIGVIPERIFGSLKVTKAILFPPNYYNDYFFFVSTFKNELTINTRICEPEKNQKLTEQYLDLIIEELKSVINRT